MTTALINGRRIVWTHALYTLYDNWTDGKLSWGDLTSPLYFGLATLAFAIPDPGTQMIGLLPARTPLLMGVFLGVTILDDLGFFGDAGFAGHKGGKQTKTVGLDYLDEWIEKENPGKLPILAVPVFNGVNQLSNQIAETGETVVDSKWNFLKPSWSQF